VNARSRPVSAALAGILLGGLACTSYKNIEIGEINEYEEVRIVLPGGAKARVFHPYAGPDTLRGYSSPVELYAMSVTGQDTMKHYRSEAPVSDIEIPIDEIESVQLRKFDPLKSLGLAAAIGLVVTGLVLVGLAASGPDCSSWLGCG